MSISIRNSEGYLDLTAYHALCRIEREEKGKSRRKYMPKVYNHLAVCRRCRKKYSQRTQILFLCCKARLHSICCSPVLSTNIERLQSHRKTTRSFYGHGVSGRLPGGLGIRRADFKRHGGRDCKSRETEYQAQIFYRKLRGGVTAYVPKRAV